MSLIYRGLLLLLPSSFRHEYGSEMARVFATRMRQSGALAAAALWLEAIADVVWLALSEHCALLRHDGRSAWRAFRRAPGYAFTAISTVALGIAASTSMFTAVDHVLLRPLPFPKPQQLVKLWENGTHRGYSAIEPSPANFNDWRRQATVFQHIAAYRGRWANLTGDGVPERLEGTAATWQLFPILGIQPRIGRTFQESEDTPGARNTVVLMHSLWVRRFGADPSILGKRLLLDGVPYEVIGVMPQSFHFPRADVEFFVAMRFTAEDFVDRGNNYLHVIARLKDTASLEQAAAEMSVVGDRVRHDHPQDVGNVGIIVSPLREEFIARSRIALYVLLAAAACVLLLGCANLANLLLARSSERRKELAVRAMLGAGRDRLTRQIVTENMLLALAGGAVGIALANAALPLLAQLVPSQLPIANQLTLDAPLIAVAVALSALTGLLFAWGPAWRMSREADLSAIAKDGGRTSGGVGIQRTRKLLVAGEVGVSVVLLVSAGLLVRTLLQVSGLDPGFQPQGVLTARAVLPAPKYENPSQRERFYHSVLNQVRTLPGVEAAGFTSFLPFTMTGGIWPVVIDGKPAVKPLPDAIFRTATPGYFEAMRIPLRAGRTFQDTDVAQAITPVIVSESFARVHWPTENALGRTLGLLELKGRVIGIVGDLPIRGLERTSKPQVYVPHTALQVGFFHAPKDLAIRVNGNPMALANAVREIVSRVDPDQPVEAVRLMTDLIGDQTASRRGQLRLLGVFTGLAFLLAIIGLQGLLSFVVSQRTQEIGIRMALGARAADILQMVFREGMALALAGALCGVMAAAWVAVVMERLLFGIKPFDAVSFSASVALCLTAAAAACYLPARRAARIDPARSMRAE